MKALVAMVAGLLLLFAVLAFFALRELETASEASSTFGKVTKPAREDPVVIAPAALTPPTVTRREWVRS